MGFRDKITRILLAFLVITLLYFSDNIDETTALALLILSCALILTAGFGVCLLYIPLRINTKKTEHDTRN